MSVSTTMRKVHRWTSVVFTVIVAYVTFAVNMGKGEPAEWVYMMPLLPLAILFLSGMYLFLRPYAARLRRRS